MVKVLTGQTPGHLTDAQAEVVAGSPVADLQNQTPQAGPSSLDELLEAAGPAPGGAPTPAGAPLSAEGQSLAEELISPTADTDPATLEQLERESVQPLGERFRDESRVDKWKTQQKITEAEPDNGNGGVFSRANDLATLVQNREIGFGLTPSRETRGAFHEGGVEGLIAAETDRAPGSLIASLNRAGAVNNVTNEQGGIQSDIDPDYVRVASVVTENALAELAFGEEDISIPQTVTDQKEGQAAAISKAQANTRLGQEIHREYMRRKNQAEGRQIDDYQDLSPEEATTVGDAFKELYAQAVGPEMITRITDPETQQVYFQLTDLGVKTLQSSATARKRMFPKVNIRPQKTPTNQLRGEQRREVKRVTGKVGTPVGRQTLDQAARNLNKVPNVVDKQRMRILFATILPALAGREGPDSLGATINNFGADKVAKFQAQEAAAQKEGKTYSAADNYSALQDSIAQSVRAIAMERNGANHFTYNIQAFNGRMAPQQTYFDATSSKAVRFVTRHTAPADTSNIRVENNLLQMYAMMLAKGADTLLPKERVRVLRTMSPQLEAWGNRLQQVLDQSMTEAEAEAVAQAIEKGTPLTDPSFPQVRGFQLDPTADAELIAAIKSKGEDGPHFIDGLIDFKNFVAAKRQGKPYKSYFNAYMDGKTNGIASNGIQMGSREVALATGVIRNNKTDLLDEGDIRDKLKEELLHNLYENGFDGTIENTAAITDVARAVFSYRDLNKATTMTFGYGKELSSFQKDIAETISYFEQVGQGGQVEVKDDPIRVVVDKNFLEARDRFTDKKQDVNRRKDRAIGEELRDYNDRLLVEDYIVASGQGQKANTVHYDYVANDGAKIEVKTIKPGDLSKGMAHEIWFKKHMEEAIESGNAPDFIEIWQQDRFGLKEGDEVKIQRLGRIPFRQYMDSLVDNSQTPGPKRRKKDGSLLYTHAVPNVASLLQPVLKVDDAVKKHGLETFNKSLAVIDEELGGRGETVETLLNMYNESLAGVLSEEAIKSRALMRSAAVLHAVTNSLFSIKSYTGFDLNLGGNETLGWEAADTTAYTVYRGPGEGHKVTAAHYKTAPTSAAVRYRADDEGVLQPDPGGDAYGGSLPGPVQSLDAATVAMTVTGESWNRLKAKAEAKNEDGEKVPYIHTIFDAFKVDAAGYDVVLDEVNKNWLKASMNWNYLEQTYIATQNTMGEFKRRMRDLPNNAPIDVSLQGEWKMMGYLLDPTVSKSGEFPSRLMRKLKNLMEKPTGINNEAWDTMMLEATARIKAKVTKAGYNLHRPEDAQAGHLKVFVQALQEELRLAPRMSKMIDHINKKKAALAKEIRSSGPVYQYYAH